MTVLDGPFVRRLWLMQEEEVPADPEGEGASRQEAPAQEAGQGQAHLGTGPCQGLGALEKALRTSISFVSGAQSGQRAQQSAPGEGS